MTVAASETFTSKELCARYRCAQVTIRRKEKSEGYPHGEKYGRNIVYAKRKVFDWERIHMPGLLAEQEQNDDDAEWDRRRRRYLLERDERAANGKKPAPPNGKRRK
jgi:hypothetical protein